MRFRIVLSLILVMICLSACGGKAALTIAPTPSVGILPLLASSTPGATATTGLVPVRTADAQTIAPSAVSPTPLATSVSVVGTRTPVVATDSRTTVAQSSPTAQPAKAARMTEIPGVAPQQTIGTAQDGLMLLNVRVGKDSGFTRIVFDLAKQDGSAAPVPQTRLWRERDTIVVAFGGVRNDIFGQSLGGSEQAINTGVVQSVYRIPVRDDSAAAYGIAVHGGAKTTLSSIASPTRVIVDIADA